MIQWGDGHQSHYELQYLRDRCPCAMCGKTQEGHTQRPKAVASPLPMYKARIRLQDVEEIGHYALRFFWNDGHSTGIYSYDHLRSICPCPECRGEKATVQ